MSASLFMEVTLLIVASAGVLSLAAAVCSRMISGSGPGSLMWHD